MINNSGGGGSGRTLITTLTFAGDTSKTASALPAYNRYELVGYMIFSGSTNPTTLGMTINNVGGTAYEFLKFTAATASIVSGVASFDIWKIADTGGSANAIPININVNGVSATNGAGFVGVNCQTGEYSQFMLSGRCTLGSAVQVSRFDFTITTAATGVLKIYGVN